MGFAAAAFRRSRSAGASAVFLWAAGLALSACSALPPAAPRAAAPPLFQLSPASLGRPLALQQRLTVTLRGRAQPPLDVLLEVDEQALQAALLVAGKTMARLRWDGRTLDAEQVPGWPQQLPVAQVLSDLQLAWWPVEELRAALPPGWSLVSDGTGRELRHGGQTVVTVKGAASARIELQQWQQGYQLLIESVALEPAADPGGAR